MASNKKSYTKEQIAEYALNGLSVQEMATKLNVDVKELEDFYIKCFDDDKASFPIRLLVTKTWLEKEMKVKSIAQICSITHTSVSVINRLVRVYKLQKRPLLKEVLTYEVLYSLFIKEQLQDSEIASRYKCSLETIKKLRASYGITYKQRVQCKPTIEQFHKLYVDYGFTSEQMIKMLCCSNNYFLELKDEYCKTDSPLAKEIANRKKYYAYQDIIKLLFKELDPAAIYEQLLNHSLSEVAEMYEIIPPAIPGVKTFTKEWVDALLLKMNVKTICEKYHISRNFIHEIYGSTVITAPSRLDLEQIRFLYIESGWEKKEIAKLFNVSEWSITSFLHKNGIYAKDRKKIEDILNIDVFYRVYVEEDLTLQQISELFNVYMPKIYELKKKYSEQNPEIESHRSRGVSDERIEFLKKEFEFKNFK